MTKIFIKVLCMSAIVATGFIVWSGTDARAQNTLPSEKVVKAIESMALAGLPNEVMRPDGTVFKIDKSDPKKLRIPMEDMKRVIRVANRTAWAKICEIRNLDVLNYETMFNAELRKKKWTKEQLAVIHGLHLQTVAWLASEKAEIVEGKTKDKPGKVVKTFKKLECSEERRKETIKAIRAYIKENQKS